VNDLPLPAFEHAIRAMHGAKALLTDRIRVEERFDGEMA
jgi:hypothetical protein